MPFITITRLPTEQDVEDAFGLELHSFSEGFNKCSVGPFVAKLEFKSSIEDGELWERYDLDGWSLNLYVSADWFTISNDLPPISVPG